MNSSPYIKGVSLGLALLSSVFYFLTSSTSVYAVSDTFIVHTFVGGDTTPPSVPAGLTATPVATSQINLSWGTSTDDNLLSGYQVFRDDTQIATTTNVFFFDTGLTASTTYTYYVTAFDSSANISASSSLVSTTTYAVFVPPPTPTTTSSTIRYGSIARLGELVSLEVIPSQYGAIIRYETSGFVRSVVRWGTSSSYELGSSAERSFSTFHEIALNDLNPGTRYRFTIEGENHRGRFGVFTESAFTTLPLTDTTPPGNALSLTLLQAGDDVVVTWQNPRDTDFARVRVLRSDLFYPSDEADGWVVYDGDGTSARDTDVAVPGKRLFYTVYTYDTDGNMSSGAVASIRITGTGTGAPIDVVDTTKNEIALTMDFVDFYQDNIELPVERGTVHIDGSRHLTIALPYDKLPEHLKTILVTITPGTDKDKKLDFLLRINKEKTAYTARLAPLGVAGDFPIRISVFDFKTAQIGYTQGRLTSVISTYTEKDDRETPLYSHPIWIIEILQKNYVILFICFLILLAFLARRLLRTRS